MSNLSSTPVHGNSSQDTNGWLIIAASLLTFSFIALTIYVDVVTGLSNAITPHEKDVMRILGLILGSFASISIILTSVLLRNGEYIKACLAGVLGLFLNLYHLSVWMAFFAGIGAHYSKNEFHNSLAYQAQKTALEILGDANTVMVDAKSVDVNRIVQLKNTLTHEETAIKKCNHIHGWRKVRDCRTEHGQRWELANNELTTLVSAQKYQSESAKQQLEKVAALKDLEMDAKNPKKFLLPLFETISNNTEEGLKYQRYFAFLLATIAILITDGGFFLIGGLISKRFQFISTPQKTPQSQPKTSETQKPTKSKINIEPSPVLAMQKSANAEKTTLWDLFQMKYEDQEAANTPHTNSGSKTKSAAIKVNSPAYAEHA